MVSKVSLILSRVDQFVSGCRFMLNLLVVEKVTRSSVVFATSSEEPKKRENHNTSSDGRSV